MADFGKNHSDNREPKVMPFPAVGIPKMIRPGTEKYMSTTRIQGCLERNSKMPINVPDS